MPLFSQNQKRPQYEQQMRGAIRSLLAGPLGTPGFGRSQADIDTERREQLWIAVFQRLAGYAETEARQIENGGQPLKRQRLLGIDLPTSDVGLAMDLVQLGVVPDEPRNRQRSHPRKRSKGARYHDRRA